MSAHGRCHGRGSRPIFPSGLVEFLSASPPCGVGVVRVLQSDTATLVQVGSIRQYPRVPDQHLNGLVTASSLIGTVPMMPISKVTDLIYVRTAAKSGSRARAVHTLGLDVGHAA
jgi:hypothetical protein